MLKLWKAASPRTKMTTRLLAMPAMTKLQSKARFGDTSVEIKWVTAD
jgi:hypothetical protein